MGSSRFESLSVTDFQNGADLYWSAVAGAHAVYGAIGAEYAATAFETVSQPGPVGADRDGARNGE